MSRIGRLPIEIPSGVEVKIVGNQVVVRGPKGELTREFHPDISISRENGHIVVSRPTDNRLHRSLHGLTRALLANMITGVSQGFSRRLEVVGVGYRADIQGSNLVLEVGYSHPVIITPPEGITVTVERGARNIVIEGIDKELVGDFAAKVRAVRGPEPYKGKGIRYEGEWVRRKAGKTGKAR